MSSPSAFARRISFLSLLIVIGVVFALSSFAFARDPYPRKVRIKDDNANLFWATEPPIPYGSLYGIRLRDILSQSDQDRYCPLTGDPATSWKCDCFFQPFGPISTWVKVDRNPNARYGDQCYSPPFTTSGGWWSWLVDFMEGRKRSLGTRYDQTPAVGIYLGIDGECRPFKSGDGWRGVGVNLDGQFTGVYVPGMIDKVKSLYPGKTIRPHMDSGYKDLYLEKEVDFHRESLEGDSTQGYAYRGAQFTGLGFK